MKTNYDIKLGVSLYSYQDNYYFHRHDLEGCIAAAAGAGAEGIEIFSDSMIEEWPYISDAFVDRWFGMMDRYGVEPVCLDHFADRAMWKNKQLSDDELFERSVMYIKAAKRLGCSAIRVMHEEHIREKSIAARLVDYDMMVKLLPVAAEHGIMLALECHAPTSVDAPYQQKYIELAEKTGIPYVGLQVDFSSYDYCMSSADIVGHVYNGATREILEYVREEQRQAYRAGKNLDEEAVAANVRKMKPTELDLMILSKVLPVAEPTEVRSIGGIMLPHKVDYENFDKKYQTLKEYASKVVYVHGKFYDIDGDGQVDNMDYPKIFDALVQGGYKGYISSEFEGNRRMNMVGWVDEIELVRKHHVLMRKCLGR